MAKTKLVEISGGFHNQMVPIRVRVPVDYSPREQNIQDVITERTYKKINNHICGHDGCMCGGIMRADIEDL